MSHRKNWLIPRAALLAVIGGTLALMAGCSANSDGQSITTVNGGSTLSISPSAIARGTGDSSGNTAVTLNWNHPEASSCTLSGTDVNGNSLSNLPASGTKAVNETYTVNTKTLGSYTFKLVCTPTDTSQPTTTDTQTVTIYSMASDLTLKAYPSTVITGGTTTLIWNHPTSSTCTASESAPDGTTVNDFTGTQTATNGNFQTQALSQISASYSGSQYVFTLNCQDGSGNNTVVNEQAKVTVVSGVANACNVTGVTTSTPLVNASTTTYFANPTDNSTGNALSSGLCLGCNVTTPTLAVDSDLTNFATVNNPVGLLGATQSFRVQQFDPATTPSSSTIASLTTFPAGQLAGFIAAFPQQSLAAGVLQTVTISTFLTDSTGVEQPQETANGTTTTTNQNGGSAKVQLLGLIGGGNLAYVQFATTKAFDAVQINLGGLANVNNTLNVYYGCVATQ